MKKRINPKALKINLSLLGIVLCATGLAMRISGNPLNRLFIAIGGLCISPVVIYNMIRSRKR